MSLIWATPIVLYDTASKVQKPDFTAMDSGQVVFPFFHPSCPKNSRTSGNTLIYSYSPLALYSDGVMPNLPIKRR